MRRTSPGNVFSCVLYISTDSAHLTFSEANPFINLLASDIFSFVFSASFSIVSFSSVAFWNCFFKIFNFSSNSVTLASICSYFSTAISNSALASFNAILLGSTSQNTYCQPLLHVVQPAFNRRGSGIRVPPG